MRLGAIRLVGVGLLVILFVCFSVFNSNSKEEKGLPVSTTADVDQVVAFQAFLSEEGGFYEQVEEVLTSKGYQYQLLGTVHSEDYVDLHIMLTNREATAQEQKEVIAVFHEIALENDLDPDVFRVKVSKGAL